LKLPDRSKSLNLVDNSKKAIVPEIAPKSGGTLADGEYARKQLYCSDSLISWSHRKRFQVALDLASRLGACRILDYGCGDGTFLGLLSQNQNRFGSGIGLEVSPQLVQECQTRYIKEPRLRFASVDSFLSDRSREKVDAIFCMEVLEHVVTEEVPMVLQLFQDCLTPGGKLFVSIPVETGIPLLIKQTWRCFAGWRGLGDYPGIEPYTWADLWRGLTAGESQHMQRPIHRPPGGNAFMDHKGFNWRLILRQIEARFTVDRVFGSQAPWLPAGMNSQVWIVARRSG
jgi:SAM-dependent methyltransferase